MTPEEVTDLFTGAQQRAPSMKALLGQAAAHYGLAPSDFLSTSRCHDITIPRQAFMWSCRQFKEGGRFRYSLPLIGRFLGGMDHTTVLHGVRAHARRLAEQAAAQ